MKKKNQFRKTLLFVNFGQKLKFSRRKTKKIGTKILEIKNFEQKFAEKILED
jgi:hypothetical protein